MIVHDKLWTTLVEKLEQTEKRLKALEDLFQVLVVERSGLQVRLDQIAKEKV